MQISTIFSHTKIFYFEKEVESYKEIGNKNF